ncbi:MAG: hypothetical protein CM15mP21_1000 [Hyphomicrobiales bacterium]|nr:MAG: hypothetical protein CM15mP21_1000 [Hyphomicrobiales bacterium]
MPPPKTVCAPLWMPPSAWRGLRCGHYYRCVGEPDFKPDLRGACALHGSRQCRPYGGWLCVPMRKILVGGSRNSARHSGGLLCDDSAVISDPRGMYGQDLRVTLHLISALWGPIRNLLACVEQCHLVCDKLVVRLMPGAVDLDAG